MAAGRAVELAPEAFFLAAAAALAVSVAGTALASAAQKGATGTPVRSAAEAVAGTATLALAVTLGAALSSQALRTVPGRDPSRFVSKDTLLMTGRIGERLGAQGRTARFLLECTSVSGRSPAVLPNGGGDAVDGVRGPVLLTLSGRALAIIDSLEPGSPVTVAAPLREIAPVRNPGEADWRDRYLLLGVRASMHVRHPRQVGLVGKAGGFTLVPEARSALSGRIRAHVGGREALYINGLLLGERNEVPAELKADFVTVGVMHLLAISGQQVVLVAMLIAALLSVLRIPPRAKFLLVSGVLAFYVVLTGGSPSVTRAGLMSVAMLGAPVVQRRADVLNSLGAAAAVILLWDPLQLFDPGFLLSFSAVMAIVLISPAILAAAPRLTARCSRRKLPDALWKGTAVSLAAGIGTAPIVSYLFGRVSIAGFVANLAVVPLSSASLVLGMLTAGASFVWPWLASVYAGAAAASARLTFSVVEYFAAMPHASVDLQISPAALVCFYLLLGACLASVSRKSWRPVVFAILVTANGAVCADLFEARRARGLRVTFLDVGQGDAAFLQFPGGETMLVDAGPRSAGSDAARRTILPFLAYAGIRKLDRLVLSHAHADHLGGATSLLRAIPVGSIVEGEPAPGSAFYREFAALADSLGVRRSFVCAGGRIDAGGNARAYILGPEPPENRAAASGGPSGEGLNDRSVILLVRFGETTLLFPGDAERDGELTASERYGPFLDSDILKAGHHGSSTSSTAEFVARVRPAWTVVSCGEGNSFGHPSAGVLLRLGAAGSAVHRTDLSGAAVFESDGLRWTPVGRDRWE